VKHASLINRGFYKQSRLLSKEGSPTQCTTASPTLVIPKLEIGALAAVATLAVAVLAVVSTAAGGVFIAAKTGGGGLFFIFVVVIVPRTGAETLHRQVLFGGGVLLHLLLTIGRDVSIPGEEVV